MPKPGRFIAGRPFIMKTNLRGSRGPCVNFYDEQTGEFIVCLYMDDNDMETLERFVNEWRQSKF
jgi:hypothetical protein